MVESNESLKCSPAWAHRGGYLAIRGPQTVAAELSTLADREFVKESATRYSYAYDERRLDLLQELLTSSARFSVSIAGSADQTVSGRKEVVSWLADIMQSQTDQRRHLISNLVVEELTSDTAVVVSYLAVYSIETTATLITTGFYRFDLVREDNFWLIDRILDGLDLPF